MREFGMTDYDFFVAVLRACPEGSHLSFDQSESESFVQQFQRWAHREDPNAFEADYYLIDSSLVEAVEQAITEGELELWHHVFIAGPDGRRLLQGVDDFYDVYLDEDLRRRIVQTGVGEHVVGGNGG